MAVRRRLHVAHQLVELIGRLGRPARPDELVGAVEVQEGDRHPAVLGLHVTGLERVAQSHRDALTDVGVRGDLLERDERVVRYLRCPPEEESRSLGLAEQPRPQGRRRAGADDDLTRVGGALHLHRGAGRRPRHDELAVRPADQEEMEVARVHAHRHPERHLLAQDRQPAHRAQGAAHLDGGPTAARLVGIAREVEEECVAAEFEEPAAVGDRQVEQGHEAVADGGRQLLRPHLAVLGQGLRQLGEAGDVDEHHRARLHAVPLRGPLGDPLDAEPGEVGHQRVGRVRPRVSRARPAGLRRDRPGGAGAGHADTVSHLSDRVRPSAVRHPLRGAVDSPERAT